MDNNRKALKSGIWYTISDFFTKSIGLITIPIFTRLLSQPEFGIYNTFISWQTVLLIIGSLQLGSSFISARYDYENDFDGYIFSVSILGVISSFLCGLVLNIIYTPLSSFFGISRLYLNAIVIYMIFFPAINLVQLRERYYFKYKVSILISIVLALSTSLLSVLLVLISENKLHGRILGSILPVVIIGIILYIFIIKKGKKLTISYWKYALPICLPFIPHLLSLTLLNSVDKIMITNIQGEKFTALYSAAYSCGAIVTMLLTSMNTAYAPWLGEMLHKKKYDEIKIFSKKYFFLFVLLAIFIMLIAPEILYIIGGTSYMESVNVIPPVACGCVFQFVYTMFVNVEQFNKKTVGMALASLTAAGLNFVLNLLLIPYFGYVAAAYTTLIGYICLAVFHMLLVNKQGFSIVYDYKFIIKILILVICVTVMVNFLYYNYVIRFIVLLFYWIILFTVLFRNRKEIISFIRKEK